MIGTKAAADLSSTYLSTRKHLSVSFSTSLNARWLSIYGALWIWIPLLQRFLEVMIRHLDRRWFRGYFSGALTHVTTKRAPCVCVLHFVQLMTHVLLWLTPRPRIHYFQYLHQRKVTVKKCLVTNAFRFFANFALPIVIICTRFYT